MRIRFLDNWHYVVMKSSLGKTTDRLKASASMRDRFANWLAQTISDLSRQPNWMACQAL